MVVRERGHSTRESSLDTPLTDQQRHVADPALRGSLFVAGPAGAGKTSGVAIVTDPATIGYPQPWILRKLPAKSMQNSVWPGAEATPIPKGEPIRLRYKLIVHRGGVETLALK